MASLNRADFEAGFSRFAQDLRSAEQAAALGRADLHAIGDTTIRATDVSWHMDEANHEPWSGPAAYQAAQAQLQTQFDQPLEKSLQQDRFGVFVDHYLAAMHARWHEEHGVPDSVPPNDPRASEHDRIHQKLDTLGAELNSAARHAPPQR